MSHTYEIEIKSLLGSKESAEELKRTLKEKGELQEIGEHSQLNHYFNAPDDLRKLETVISPHVSEEKKGQLKKILEDGANHSVRTRDADGKVIFVVKASVGDDTSANGVSRIEFESEVGMSLDELDALLLDAGLTYQAKWSRDREEFKLGDMNITIDKNAGYGYLAEFEKVVDDSRQAPDVEAEIRSFMKECSIDELPQDRLERMFAYYNANWGDYYGSDKIFNIE
jgi:adenylate cyclase class IV